MDDDREPQRIEIELTAHEPESVRRTASRSAAASADADTVDEERDDRGPLGSERGRLVAVGATAALVALLAGVFVGRMGSAEVATSDSAPTTTEVPAPTTTSARGAETLPRAPLVLSPSTTVPRPAPTDPERPVKGQVAVHPAAATAPIEVVALTNRGELVRIDATSGRTVTIEIYGAQNGPPTIYAGDGWILLPSFDPQHGSTVVHDDGTRSKVDVGAAWPLMVDSERGTMWRIEPSDGSGPPLHLREIGIDGTETGSLIDLHGFYPQMADPLGGVVVQAPGGHFVLTPDGATRITTGTLIALGRERALVRECDEVLVCGYAVIDRASGRRTPLTLDPALGDHPTLEFGWWAFRDPVSPTGDAVLVSFWDQSGSGRQRFGVLDLSSGGFLEIDATGGDIPLLEWTPDGRSLLWLDRGRLSVFDLDTGESVPFSDDLGTLNAFAVRPALPSFDEPSTSPPPSSLPGESTDGG